MIRKTPALLAIAAIFVSTLSFAEEFVSDDDLFADDFEQTTRPVADPFKGANKAIFKFNDYVYLKLLKPVSKGYEKVMPNIAEKGIHNFFENLKYPRRLVSNVLQLKFKQAGKETGKFLIDTTVGLGGTIAVSKGIPSLETTNEDLGQALGKWGVGHGFYIVVPFLGPTTLRDGFGRIGESYLNPTSRRWDLVTEWEERLALTSLDVINESPQLIEFYESFLSASIAPYEGIKDGYIQGREKQVAE
tara:strand:- start:561 stop:1298 length:738 start_codon:yes stop_codon:yes gene_type:complete